jgi:hypothetical protein
MDHPLTEQPSPHDEHVEVVVLTIIAFVVWVVVA